MLSLPMIGRWADAMLEEQQIEHRRPHPFFWVTLATVGAGILCAALAGSASPAWALDSNVVYRALVGLATGGIAYLVTVVIWNAWHGRAVPLGLPGGSSVDPVGQPLDAAATDLESAAADLDELRSAHERRFEALEEAIVELDERVTATRAADSQQGGGAHDVS